MILTEQSENKVDLPELHGFIPYQSYQHKGCTEVITN